MRAKKAIKGKKGKSLTSAVRKILVSEGRSPRKRVSTITVRKSSNKPSQTKKGIKKDSRIVAMPAGKRKAGVTAKRKFYYESQKNRSDNLGSK